MKYFSTISWLLLTSTFMPLMAQAEEIKLLSYNVYFDDETGKTRYPEIIKFIKQGDYNVIALQECTPLFLSLLTRDSTLRYFTRQQGSMRDGYTNIILTSLNTKQTGDIKLPTKKNLQGHPS
jgi:endonuclease/exonuclease/phosphatase family metal-dependent hydrolase